MWSYKLKKASNFFFFFLAPEKEAYHSCVIGRLFWFILGSDFTLHSPEKQESCVQYGQPTATTQAKEIGVFLILL